MTDKKPESALEARARKEHKRLALLDNISDLQRQLQRLKVEANNDEAMNVLASHVTEPLHEALMVESDSIRGDFKIARHDIATAIVHSREAVMDELRKLRAGDCIVQPRRTYAHTAFFLIGVAAGLLLARVLGGLL